MLICSMHQEQSSSINLVFFNVNGLGQDAKSKSVFEKLKKLDLYIILTRNVFY